jgi:hypothetical protein
MNNKPFETTVMIHKAAVETKMKKLSREIRERGSRHDNSKLSDMERPHLEQQPTTIKVQKVCETDDSCTEEYDNALTAFHVGMIQHYKNNDHHIEHFQKGVYDMNLVQLLEYVCDVVARAEESNLPISDMIKMTSTIHENDPVLYEILMNTVPLIQKK